MSYLSQMCSLTVQQFVTPAVGIGAALGHHPRLLQEGIADRRQLLGRRHPRPALRAHPDRHHRRPDLRRPGRHRHAGWAGQHPQLAQRRLADHRPRAGRLHGGHQAAGHQRRRVLQHQLGPSVREPDRPDQPALHLPAAVHPGRPDLRLRQDGRGPPPGRGRPGRHVHHLRCLGRHLRRSRSTRPTQPCRPPASSTNRRGTPRARRSDSASRARRSSGWRRPRPPPDRPTPPTTPSRRSAAA